MVEMAPRSFLPDRPPTWAEVGLSLLVSVVYLPQLVISSSVSWPVVFTGIAVSVVVLGPIANSRGGRRVETRFKAVSIPHRVLVLSIVGIVLLGGAMAVASVTSVTTQLLLDASYGGMAGVVVYVFVHLLHARTVSGWVHQ